MENSDDYFDDDDLVLDEATEAAIAESERQHATQALPLALPVAKKQRTATGWSPGLGARADSLADLDYPEITVQGNGYYASARKPPTPPPIPAPVSDVQHRNTSRESGSNPPPARPNWQINAPRRTTYKGAPAPIPQRPHHQPSSQHLNRSASSSTRKPSPPHHLDSQLQQLRQQLDQLRQSNAEMQSALQGALESKTAKDGEVTILRKTIEKNSQAHAVEVARLKAAKQEAEAKQIQIQKALKDDMERLKTQLNFKQQELEASLRKPPPSVRPKKTFRDPPATPLPSSSAGGTWNMLSQRPTFSIDAQQTPLRPIYVPPLSPRKASQKSPAKSKKPVMLPGFQNSFASSTPPRNSQLKKKGKEREQFPDEPNMFEPIPHIQQFARPFLSPTKQDKPEQPSPERSAPTAPVENIFNPQPFGNPGEADILMAPSQIVNNEDEQTEEFDIIDPPNWKAELCRIILTHIRIGNNQLTFQQLLVVTFTGQNELEDSRVYTSSYIYIMNAISNPAKMEGYEQCLGAVANSFITIIDLLTRNKLASQLANLFNLLATLVFYLPKFRSSMFGQDGPIVTAPLVCVIKQVIIGITPPLTGEDDLGRELLGFLETMSTGLSEDDALKFSVLVRDREVMMALLNPAQPAPFLEQVARTLVFLSIRKQLCWSLLSLPNPDQAEDTPIKNGLTERLCSYLIDSTRDGPEFYKLKETIMTYFAQLSLSHPDAYSTLSSLPIFLASVLWHIAQLATPLWEDDERLMESPSNSLELIEYIGRAIYFMHHLIFSTEPTLNLRYKLQQAPPRPFSNILQVFVVAFGRLSYAEAPDWLDENSRNRLEQLIEMARDILELVVDGPEGDDIWHAYQDDLEEKKHLDEEEMEAQMVEAD